MGQIADTLKIARLGKKRLYCVQELRDYFMKYLKKKSAFNF